MSIKQFFGGEEKFVNYTQFIPITFFVIWLVLLFYISFEAPTPPDEMSGRIYPVTVKSRTAYLTMTEEILICGSTIGWVGSFVILQAMTIFGKDSNKKE